MVFLGVMAGLQERDTLFSDSSRGREILHFHGLLREKSRT
jgi:hypothetical protein